MNDGDRLILAPAEGCRVRKPDGQPLADAGESIVVDSFWRRRLRDGDVAPATAAGASPAQAAPPPAAPTPPVKAADA